jgi:hypothetical protein
LDPDVFANVRSPTPSSMAQRQRDLGAADDVDAGAGIDVEGQRRGPVQVGARVQRRVQLDRADAHRPQQRGQLLDDAEVDVRVLSGAPDRRRLHPRRPMLGAALLPEARPLDALRVALHVQQT